jgi:hypothetical protein
MNAILRLVACGLALLLTIQVVSSTPITDTTVPRYFQRNPFTRRDLTVQQVQKELGPLLHNGSLIFGPSDPAWQNATERWNTFSMPHVEIVVEVNQETDIAIVVCATVSCQSFELLIDI